MNINCMSFEDFVSEQKLIAKRSAQKLLSHCSASLGELSIIYEPALETKEIDIEGIKVTAHVHIDKYALEYYNAQRSDKLGSLVQIFMRELNIGVQKSVILAYPQETLSQAGCNWRGETMINDDDLLNRTVAALRLSNREPVLHLIATHIAYETVSVRSNKPYYKGIDATALHSVWD